MTIAEKKIYLKKYKHLIEQIKYLEAEQENLKYMMMPGGIDYSKDKIQTSPSNSQMADYVARVMELEENIFKLKADAIKTCNEIVKVISECQNELYQNILHARYILLKSWEEISNDLNYSTQRLYELHCEALCELNIKTSE